MTLPFLLHPSDWLIFFFKKEKRLNKVMIKKEKKTSRPKFFEDRRVEGYDVTEVLTTDPGTVCR
jgi:hypothetical protein